MIFEDIDDVIEWLEPLSYCQLWDALAPYDVFDTDTRDHCDERIASGNVEQTLVLSCLKTEARLALTQMFGLKDRIHEPISRQYLQTIN